MEIDLFTPEVLRTTTGGAGGGGTSIDADVDDDDDEDLMDGTNAVSTTL